MDIINKGRLTKRESVAIRKVWGRVPIIPRVAVDGELKGHCFVDAQRVTLYALDDGVELCYHEGYLCRGESEGDRIRHAWNSLRGMVVDIGFGILAPEQVQHVAKCYKSVHAYTPKYVLLAMTKRNEWGWLSDINTW